MGNGFWGTGYGEREDRTSYAPSPVTQNLSPVTLLPPQRRRVGWTAKNISNRTGAAIRGGC